MLAGDTDTNCAIVGGLVGAYVGIKNMPPQKVQKVLECDHSTGRQPHRPDIVKASKDGLDCIVTLLQILPEQLQVEDKITKE